MEGLHLFQIHIPGHQMRQEVFIPLLTCNRCNAVEDHATKSCPKPASYVLCSECGNEDHSFRTCTATSKKCLHCGGEHSARAMHCPMRKEALKNKEEAARQARVRPSVSIAQAAQSAPAPAAPIPADPTKTLASLMCLFHAHLANTSAPGCFQETLSASLAENGLPDVQLPSPPPHRAPESLFRGFALAPEPVPSPATASAPEDNVSTPSDDASSVASTTSDDDTESTWPTVHENVRFGFIARNKRRKIPSTSSELEQSLRKENLVLSHTGPQEVRQIVLEYVKETLPPSPPGSYTPMRIMKGP